MNRFYNCNRLRLIETLRGFKLRNLPQSGWGRLYPKVKEHPQGNGNVTF
jgi:hypothetical protein